MRIQFFQADLRMGLFGFSSYLLWIIGLAALVVNPVWGQVMINEIHYDPDRATDLVEFVELYNAGEEDVDLSGWSIGDAIAFTFPDSTVLAAGSYLVVAMDRAALISKYTVSSSFVVGPFEGRLDNDGENVELRDGSGSLVDQVDYSLGFPWPTVGEPISENQPGTGFSIQLINPDLDNDLGGSWRSASPTPGAVNSVFVENAPPLIRQVLHTPEEPVSGETVFITAKITDSDGVDRVQLLYQLVDPGDYIHITDGRYQTDWTEIEMRDDGSEGDEIAGDAVYTVALPPSFQVHRRLVRYRIKMSDTAGLELTVPYADDPQPNFAYFVYDGVPDWIGAVRPGVTTEETYPSEMLSSLPVYHLITSKEEAENCTWLDQFSHNEYVYTGTIVYGSQVLDHVFFRARGGTWRFAMGKNMWKFNFNRGHALQARDIYRNKYSVEWDKLNLGACIQQGDYLHRGEQGMFEAVGFRLFNLAGVEAPHTHYIHFRIIDEAHEDGRLNASHPPLTDSGTQYDGDFWGLYLATEQIDGRFLEEHGMADGNLYKMEGGTGELKNQAPTGVSDKSDLNAFMRGYSSRPDEQWWRENVDLKQYYPYRAILEAIHHYDNGYGKNYYYHLDPETQIWTQLPWDIDLTWADNMFGNGNEPFNDAGLLRIEALGIEYQNRLREIRDLLYNPDQTGQLIDEYASLIYTPGELSFVDADRAMWDYHWVMSDEANWAGYKNRYGKSGQGRFYQIAATKDFPGMMKIMKDYVVSRGEWIDTRLIRDSQIPDTPVVIPGASNDYSIDSLVFETSPFSDLQGADTFAALQWRIAEVEPDAQSWEAPVEEEGDVLILDASTWKYFKGTEEPSNPVSAWRELSFDDSNWMEGQAPIGYGEDFMITQLDDMRYNYSTVYLRKEFEIADLDSIGSLTLQVLFDDGFNLWINGRHVAQANVNEAELPFDAVATHREDLTFADFPLSNPKTYLVEGTNVIAIQLINQYIDQSSDCFFDLRLVSGAEEDSGETPYDGTFRPFTEPGKYEIIAAWESEELSTFESNMTIPASAVTVGRTYRVRARMKDTSGRWSHWSAPAQFIAQESANSLALLDFLRITEVMYNPAGDSEFEYIELHNTHSSQTLSLGGLSFTEGITFTFPEGVELSPGGYLLVVSAGTASERAAFRAHYVLSEEVMLIGPYSGKLANGGERLTLRRSVEGPEIVQFTFSDGRGWPLASDGAGHSLAPLDTAIAGERDGSLEYGGNWRASAVIGGSPGRSNPVPIQNVVLNEFMANTSGEGRESNDWIELFNLSSTSVHLGDWYISDDPNELRKWNLPAMDIEGLGRVSFDESAGFNNPPGSGFGLSKEGEVLLLSYLPGVAGVDRVVDAVRFKAQEADLSLGRDGDGEDYWRAMAPSRGATNHAGAAVVVIDELMYHPLSIDHESDDDSIGEYIELYNPTAQPAALWNENGPWRLDGGVEYLFPEGVMIPVEGRLLIVNFDPTDSNALTAFLTAYPLVPADAPLLGPYAGRLSNQGERIALEKPLFVDFASGQIAWAIVDEVIYFHQAPWPVEPDGAGQSLQRINGLKSGNNPKEWTADDPSPGQAGTPDTSVNSWMVY